MALLLVSIEQRFSFLFGLLPSSEIIQRGQRDSTVGHLPCPIISPILQLHIPNCHWLFSISYRLQLLLCIFPFDCVLEKEAYDFITFNSIISRLPIIVVLKYVP